MSDDFSVIPVSIAARRAERDRDCTAWKPRDVLIEMLRSIDSGEEVPTDLIICHSHVTQSGGLSVGFMRAHSAGHELQTGLGLLRLVEHRMIENAVGG